MKSLDMPHGGIIYADPLFTLAEELKDDASAFRRSRKEHPDAEILESIAARLLERIASATTREWLSDDEQRRLLDTPTGVAFSEDEMARVVAWLPADEVYAGTSVRVAQKHRACGASTRRSSARIASRRRMAPPGSASVGRCPTPIRSKSSGDGTSMRSSPPPRPA